MDKKIKDIIKKVRAIYKYDDRFKSLVSMHPTVKLEKTLMVIWFLKILTGSGMIVFIYHLQE